LAAAATRVLYYVNPGDISIRHHWTDARLRLHSFRHRSYWYHGRSRERDVLQRIHQLVRPGDFVLDVGGHIGYVSQLLSHLVGAGGRVLVFEPGSNNLPYLRSNVQPLRNIDLIEKAVSDRAGVVALYEEQLSGQNNSLLSDYQSFQNNCQRLGQMTQTHAVQVQCTTLDDEIERAGHHPSFVKIDVEGAEYQVLCGARKLLAQDGTALMIEITAQAGKVVQLLREFGYHVVSTTGEQVNDDDIALGNYFCLKANDPRCTCFDGSLSAT
ncbi:MAG: FkbM family methyltransferase, partial [Planctomycetales bacterium]|nr:FkbM family methyltransferase [Planctomycetales bacterium]